MSKFNEYSGVNKSRIKMKYYNIEARPVYSDMKWYKEKIKANSELEAWQEMLEIMRFGEEDWYDFYTAEFIEENVPFNYNSVDEIKKYISNSDYIINEG